MKILRILGVFITLFCLIFTIVFGAKNIDKSKALSNSNLDSKIINLWHVDTFEGGTGSRKQFLLKVAREFEKENNGVLVFATNHTVNSVIENFNNGIYPDIISFSLGVEVDNVVSLNLSKEFNFGMFLDKNLLIPWCRGGYFIIENTSYKGKKGEKAKCLISNSEYNLPIISILDKGYNFDLVNKSQYNAYLDFVYGNAEYLLGTQRDIVRLTNRAFTFSAEPLDSFNDLYQYVCVLNTNKEKIDDCVNFIEFLLSERVQNSLNQIDMFSCFYNVSFENEYMALMQKIDNFSSISPFNKREALLELKETSFNAYLGDKDKVNKLKNFII